MQNILVVEDSLVMQTMISDSFENAGFKVIRVSTFSQVMEAVEDNNNNFFLAILDLNLPDTQEDEIVTYMLEQNIKSIVYSGSYDYKKVEQLMSKPIVDYVIKNSDKDIEYIVGLAQKLEKYKDMNLLLVDDSNVTLSILEEYIKPLGFNIFTAKNGKDAITIVDKEDISIVITDYYMPEMDGFELTKALRSKHSKGNLVIISITSADSIEVSTKMIKYGANSFLRKPYSKDELNTVVNNQMSTLFHVKEKLKYQKDLTKLIKQIKVNNLQNNLNREQEHKENIKRLEQVNCENKRLQSIIKKQKTDYDYLVEKVKISTEKSQIKETFYKANTIDNYLKKA